MVDAGAGSSVVGFFIHVQLWGLGGVKDQSSPAAAESKGTGNADGSHSVQPIRILNDLSFQR